MKIFFRKSDVICRIKCNRDNETQSFKMWPKPSIKIFTLSGCPLQINVKIC